jgi:hypothetical protein
VHTKKWFWPLLIAACLVGCNSKKQAAVNSQQARVTLPKDDDRAKGIRKEGIKRDEDYLNPGEPVVSYSDGREDDFIINYVDLGKDGKVNYVYYTSATSRVEMVFRVYQNKGEAERFNLNTISNGPPKRGYAVRPEFAFWANSPEGRRLQTRYVGAVMIFHELHPGVK